MYLRFIWAENLSKIYRRSIENLSKIYRTSIENLSKIYRESMDTQFSRNFDVIAKCWSFFKEVATESPYWGRTWASSDHPPPLENLSKIYRTSIENLSKIYRKSIENLSRIYRKSIETYRKSIENLSKIYRESIENI